MDARRIPAGCRWTQGMAPHDEVVEGHAEGEIVPHNPLAGTMISIAITDPITIKAERVGDRTTHTTTLDTKISTTKAGRTGEGGAEATSEAEARRTPATSSSKATAATGGAGAGGAVGVSLASPSLPLSPSQTTWSSWPS